jgi:hypothetical protein
MRAHKARQNQRVAVESSNVAMALTPGLTGS